MQNSLFDLENRYASLSKTGDPLERLNAIIDWEIFRSSLSTLTPKNVKARLDASPYAAS
jgi:IS5 family transposase